MKIRIQGQPEFLLPLTVADVEMIRKVSAKHYDFVCRNASAEDYDPLGRNFLTTWRNVLNGYVKYPPDDPEFVPCVSATWTQIDTTLKILESCNLFMLTDIDALGAKHLSNDLREALRAAADAYGAWHTVIDTSK